MENDKAKSSKPEPKYTHLSELPAERLETKEIVTSHRERFILSNNKPKSNQTHKGYKDIPLIIDAEDQRELDMTFSLVAKASRIAYNVGVDLAYVSRAYYYSLNDVIATMPAPEKPKRKKKDETPEEAAERKKKEASERRNKLMKSLQTAGGMSEDDLNQFEAFMIANIEKLCARYQVVTPAGTRVAKYKVMDHWRMDKMSKQITEEGFRFELIESETGIYRNAMWYCNLFLAMLRELHLNVVAPDSVMQYPLQSVNLSPEEIVSLNRLIGQRMIDKITEPLFVTKDLVGFFVGGSKGLVDYYPEVLVKKFGDYYKAALGECGQAYKMSVVVPGRRIPTYKRFNESVVVKRIQSEDKRIKFDGDQITFGIPGFGWHRMGKTKQRDLFVGRFQNQYAKKVAKGEDGKRKKYKIEIEHNGNRIELEAPALTVSVIKIKREKDRNGRYRYFLSVGIGYYDEHAIFKKGKKHKQLHTIGIDRGARNNNHATTNIIIEQRYHNIPQDDGTTVTTPILNLSDNGHEVSYDNERSIRIAKEAKRYQRRMSEIERKFNEHKKECKKKHGQRNMYCGKCDSCMTTTSKCPMWCSETQYTPEYERWAFKYRKAQSKVAAIREGARQQYAASVVRQAETIVIEDLKTKGMMRKVAPKVSTDTAGKETFEKNGRSAKRTIARKISASGFYKTESALVLHAKKTGTTTLKAHKLFPSSKTCNICGHINQKMNSSKVFVCEVDSSHTFDRDINASINLAKRKNNS